MKEGTFVVTHAGAGSAVVRDAETAQVHTLETNPGVETGDVVEAALEPVPPLEVTWRATVETRQTPTVERVGERPPDRAFDAVAGADPGTATELDDGTHVIAVPVDDTEDAAADVATDESTLARAARLGADRVEVRAADGVVAVEYL